MHGGNRQNLLSITGSWVLSRWKHQCRTALYFKRWKSKKTVKFVSHGKEFEDKGVSASKGAHETHKGECFFFSRSTLICAQLIPKDSAVNGKSPLGSSALLVCSSDAYCASMEDGIRYFLVNFTSNKFCAGGLEENNFCPAFWLQRTEKA